MRFNVQKRSGGSYSDVLLRLNRALRNFLHKRKEKYLNLTGNGTGR